MTPIYPALWRTVAGSKNAYCGFLACSSADLLTVGSSTSFASKEEFRIERTIDLAPINEREIVEKSAKIYAAELAFTPSSKGLCEIAVPIVDPAAM
ncbi:hypothetical protein JANAI62_35820 [Jannaschia pagri]|uniref:Uncharacterized protein n=1 Tax=Jannaschia pagri TaxID=2829797 RepID=A0ABQ4NRT9_9RHOB|nr:hypothetical protein JANAI61_35920 [Jannaschia sp. AI_61]GIT96959.1 hypothetical protein JANAI62_35820 [Jannaschia sp. AI_62]